MDEVFVKHAAYFFNRLVKEYSRISKRATAFNINCYRIYDRDMPEVPLSVDKYGNHLQINDYRKDKSNLHWLDLMIAQIVKVIPVSEDDIHVKSRYSRAGGQYGGEGLKSANTVNEQGFVFEVNLRDYADTGLFLDHRLTRETVRRRAGGKSFLNLFSYTGAFTVYAAAGGAAKTVSVDLSKKYTEWAKRNMKANNFEGDRHKYVVGDCIEYLNYASSESFDLAVVDPPTFSVSKRTDVTFDVQRDHVKLLNTVFKRMNPGGIVFFSTNRKKFSLDAGALNARKIENITKKTIPFDFKKHRPHRCWEILL